jgi:diguanylate cyclase (GGDEF)-like protein
MRMLRDLSIDKKLTLIILLTSSIALLSAAAGFVVYELDAVRDGAAAELAALAGVIGANAAAAVDFEQPGSAEDILATLGSERQIVAACIYGRDDRIFAGFLRSDRESCPEGPDSEGAGARGRMALSRTIESETGDVVGTIYLESDLQALGDRLARYAVIVAGVLLVSFLVAWALSSRLQSMVSRPILQLARTARSVSQEHDFSVRARGAAGRDEVGQLIVAFNDMLAQIQERDAVLVERTREIEDANRELEREVSERKRAERKIRALADHDALTGLPNRRLFKDRVRMAIGQARRHRRQPSVLFLDLDRFKLVNDSLGHDVGDLLLKKVGERLAGAVRETDTVARLGGDEFTILLPDAGQATDVARAAEKILATLRRPFDLEEREVYITPSVGIAIFPEDGEDVDALIKNADTAMYRAKEAGRDNYQLYTAAMNAQALERLGLESRLRKALENAELEIHYQPVVSIRGGQVHGVEALLRWRHPERGLVSPADFIPIAEATGLIVPIGAWVLSQACAQARLWERETGLPPLSMAVNLSARQLQQSDVVSQVEAALRQSGLDAGKLELEITESSAIQSPEAAIRTLQELRKLGVRISLDDFGVGYSSLTYVRRLPIDTVKVDRSFVRDVCTDPADAAIVSAVIEMSHLLGFSVVAEGVESEEQLDWLRARGCDRLQGYYFSPALLPEACAELLREGMPVGQVARGTAGAAAPRG